MRPLVDLQHILHAGYEGGVGIRRDDPLLLQVRLESVFFSVRPIVLSLARSTMFSSTTALFQQLSASTACDPSAVRNRPGRSAWLRRRRRRCAVWPSWANACGSARPRSLPPPVAGGSGQRCRCWYPAPSAIWLSLQPSPASEASAFSRMRAFSSCRAGLVPFCISVLSRSRSSSLSFTMYLFTAGCFAVTTHLRASGDIDSEIGRRINDAGH